MIDLFAPEPWHDAARDPAVQAALRAHCKWVFVTGPTEAVSRMEVWGVGYETRFDLGDATVEEARHVAATRAIQTLRQIFTASRDTLLALEAAHGRHQ